MRVSKDNLEGYRNQATSVTAKSVGRKGFPTESDEQITLFEWSMLSERRYPELRFLHHIPNGGLRNTKTAVRLKREGVKAGVPDICLPVSRHDYHGLYIELKRKGGRITELQQEWLNALKQGGYFAVVAYGFDEAKGVIEWYLGGVECLKTQQLLTEKRH